MCLHPIHINFPYKSLGNANFQSFSSLSVPCGRCSQCLSSKMEQYKLRVIHEYNDTINKGGFVFWDTLTYSPANVPYVTMVERGTLIKDVSVSSDVLYLGYVGKHQLTKKEILNTNFVPFCYRGHAPGLEFKDFVYTFNKHDLTLFFKKFRMRLKRYLDKNNIVYCNDFLKYFVVSEYGGSFCRPHYHVIFFLRFSLSPVIFNKMLMECWEYGITDVSKTPTEKVVNGLGALCYVSKYVVKDYEFSDKLKSFIRQYGTGSSLNRILQPFSHCSINFGISALDSLNKDTLQLSYNDNKGIHLLSLPSYFKRKLFYTKYNIDGKYLYLLDYRGINFLVNSFDFVVSNTSNSLVQNLNKIKTFFSSFSVDFDFMPYSLDDIFNFCNTLLGDKILLNHLSIYKVYYRNRFLFTDVKDVFELFEKEYVVTSISNFNIDFFNNDKFYLENNFIVRNFDGKKFNINDFRLEYGIEHKLPYLKKLNSYLNFLSFISSVISRFSGQENKFFENIKIQRRLTQYLQTL